VPVAPASQQRRGTAWVNACVRGRGYVSGLRHQRPPRSNRHAKPISARIPWQCSATCQRAPSQSETSGHTTMPANDRRHSVDNAGAQADKVAIEPAHQPCHEIFCSGVAGLCTIQAKGGASGRNIRAGGTNVTNLKVIRAGQQGLSRRQIPRCTPSKCQERQLPPDRKAVTN